MAIAVEALNNILRGRLHLNWEQASSRLNPSQKSLLRILDAQELAIFGVSSRKEILELRSNPSAKVKAESSALDYFARRYGIPGGEEAVRDAVRGYSEVADAYIDQYRTGRFQRFATDLEMEDAVHTSNVVDLFILIHDSNSPPQSKSEARRKLYLMNIAATNDARDRAHNSLQVFESFKGFIRTHVLTPQTATSSRNLFLVSQHSDVDFSVARDDLRRPKSAKIEQVTQEAAAHIPRIKGQKITPLPVRYFTDSRGKDIPVYFRDRAKGKVETVGKMVRKTGDNPNKEIEDLYGIMLIVPAEEDVDSLTVRLVKTSAHGEFVFGLEDMENNFHGERRKDHTRTGAEQLTMAKFIANIHGDIRIEVMMHTWESYLNYLYQRGHAYGEFVIRRMLDGETTSLLFPYFIYGVDFEAEKEDMLRRLREEIEDPRIHS